MGQEATPGADAAIQNATISQYIVITGEIGSVAAANAVAASVNVFRIRWVICDALSTQSQPVRVRVRPGGSVPPLSISMKPWGAFQGCARCQTDVTNP